MGRPDIDFTDVFGGPPRTHERRSYSSAFVGNCQTHAFSCSDRWSGAQELPPFGSDNHYHDFFHDIFRGRNKSLSSKSLSARFSVPASWTNERDLTKCALKNYACNSSSSICSSNISLFQSSRVSRIDEESDSRVLSDYCPGPLSWKSFPNADKSFNFIELDKASHSMEESNIMAYAKHSESRTPESPLVTPSSSGFSSLSDGTTIISIHELVGKQGTELLDMDDFSLPIKDETSQMVKDKIISLHELETTGAFCINDGISTGSTTMVETKPHALFPSRCQRLQEQAAVVMGKDHKAESKPLHAFLCEKDDEPDNSGTGETRKGGHRPRSTKQQAMDGGLDACLNVDEQDEKARTLKDGAEARSTTIQGYPKSNVTQSRVKEKAKEFMKIFNRETPSKQTGKKNSRSLSFRRKTRFCADEVYPRSSIHTRRSMTIEDSPFMGEEYQKDHVLSKDSERKIGSSSKPPHDTDNVSGVMDKPFLENFEIEELKPDEHAQLQGSDDCEKIKAMDANIQQWSLGKEHNIRSLLSTLQYVLWPESGWKSVPLIDIIEEAAVKRSYQRALLCLHPDKLQQKGAAPHQKYIARQVYEILQEAWSPFV